MDDDPKLKNVTRYPFEALLMMWETIHNASAKMPLSQEMSQAQGCLETQILTTIKSLKPST